MKDYHTESTHFHLVLRKNMSEAKGGRRDEIDVLRTAFWFSEIKVRLNAATAYEVEGILENEAFGENEYGDPYHKNKWTKYQVGLHVPSNTLVTQVDEKLPGTKQLLNHVLWTALQAKSRTRESADDWLRQLSPEIQKVVFKANLLTPKIATSRNPISSTQLKMLERRAGIDALACLTILLRESCIAKDQNTSLEIGGSLYRVLLILSTAEPIRNFSSELLNIYIEKVFSEVRCNGLRFRFEDFDFPDAIYRLTVLLLQLEDSGQIGFGWDDSVQAMCSLLDGGYGFDVKFALGPPIGPDEPLTDGNAEAYRDYERINRYRTWGKDQMFSKERDLLPPD